MTPIELEREECAKIADKLSNMLVHTKQEWTPLGIIEECAYMIRERRIKSMSKETKINVPKLANAHWDYVGSVLMAHGVSQDSKLYNACAFHYITAFEHGWKHGVEYMKEKEECC